MTNEEVKTSLDDDTVTMKDIFKVLVEINTKLDILVNKNNTIGTPYTPTPTFPTFPYYNPYEVTCKTTAKTSTDASADKFIKDW